MGTIIGTILGRLLAYWVFIGFIFALITLFMARDRGRSKVMGFIGGYVFGIWSVIYYLIAGDSTETRVRKEEAIKKHLKKEKLSEQD